MQSSANPPRKAANVYQWFDLRHADLGSFAFIMNRVSGIGLVVYLFLHLIMLGQLALGAAAYDGFIALVRNPVFIAGEFVVVIGVLLHGLNGVRVVLTSLGFGVTVQKGMFYALMTLAVLACIVFALKMFGGA